MTDKHVFNEHSVNVHIKNNPIANDAISAARKSEVGVQIIVQPDIPSKIYVILRQKGQTENIDEPRENNFVMIFTSSDTDLSATVEFCGINFTERHMAEILAAFKTSPCIHAAGKTKKNHLLVQPIMSMARPNLFSMIFEVWHGVAEPESSKDITFSRADFYPNDPVPDGAGEDTEIEPGQP